MAGLGLVLSQYACANIDLSLPFVDVIPEDKIHDVAYVRAVIEKNRVASLKNRYAIRRYAMEHFSWFNIVKRYVQSL